jgi:hypothetical protein
MIPLKNLYYLNHSHQKYNFLKILKNLLGRGLPQKQDKNLSRNLITCQEEFQGEDFLLQNKNPTLTDFLVTPSL